MEPVIDSFDKIIHDKKVYNVQGKVLYTITYCNENNSSVDLIIIIQDINEKRVTVMARGTQGLDLTRKIKEQYIYKFTNCKAELNKDRFAFRHKFNLKMKYHSKVIRLQNQFYKKGNKFCVRSNRISTTRHQTTLQNWMKEQK